MKNTKKILIVVMVLIMVLSMCSCRQADRVSWNVSKEADAFNVVRKLTVMNARTDTVLLEMIGRFALKNNGVNELVIISEVAQGEYKKNYVYLNDYTLYVVEDISGSEVSPYQYEVNFLPQMIPLYDITMSK